MLGLFTDRIINRIWNKCPENIKRKLFALLEVKDSILGPSLIDNIKARTIPHEELTRLVFGQQHYGTQKFFKKEYGQYYSIPLDRIPHHVFLNEHLGDPFNDHLYMKYLDAEWGFKNALAGTNTLETRVKKIEDFINLYHDIDRRAKNGIRPIRKPITACERPDGKWIIIRGNHRAAIALKLGLDLRVRFVHPKRYLTGVSITMLPTERYLHWCSTMPQMSLYDRNSELVQGRQRNVAELMRSLNQQDIQGKDILDLGCNIGSRCFLAAMSGARQITGIDKEVGYISSAVRLNAFFATSASFVVCDPNKDIVRTDPVDTVLCFSIADKIINRDHFIETLLQKTRQVLYFELPKHVPSTFYEHLLNKQNFSMIEEVHQTNEIQRHKVQPSTIYRCVTAR